MRVSAFLLVLLVVLWASTGCRVLRFSQATTAEAVAATHALTVQRALEGETAPHVTISGASNVVHVAPVPLKSETIITDAANTRGTASGTTKTSFRLGISTMVTGAIALALLLVAYILWAKLTAAGKASDSAFAGLARSIRIRCESSTDANEIARLSPLLAEVESARGRLK